MLPSPVSFPSRRSHALTRPARTADLLRAPARLTNLAVLLLVSLLAFSLLLNIQHSLSSPTIPSSGLSLAALPFSVAATLRRPARARTFDHLVVVPGHGIWTGTKEEDALDERLWVMADYQRGKGRPRVFVEHIRRGAEIAAKDPGALLVFSGCVFSPAVRWMHVLTTTSRGHRVCRGQTDATAPTTEAESYLRLALAAALLPPSGDAASPLSKATTELFALDSFQNLLFALARFREVAGAYPRRITVVGHEFKRRRFEELHRKALRWPAGKFEYVGVGLDDAKDEARASAGEIENSFAPFSKDLYGCHPPLSTKRAGRNPHLRAHPYHLAAPELAELFEWCPVARAQVFAGELPWDA
ncbi:hypothetical protein OF83DRAFT_769532 [Amylostereum chailletii]|nr:hypothetical protein OF83DRAFT_769532 [Amylostereum chailletii]